MSIKRDGAHDALAVSLRKACLSQPDQIRKLRCGPIKGAGQSRGVAGLEVVKSSLNDVNISNAAQVPGKTSLRATRDHCVHRNAYPHTSSVICAGSAARPSARRSINQSIRGSVAWRFTESARRSLSVARCAASTVWRYASTFPSSLVGDAKSTDSLYHTGRVRSAIARHGGELVCTRKEALTLQPR